MDSISCFKYRRSLSQLTMVIIGCKKVYEVSNAVELGGLDVNSIDSTPEMHSPLHWACRTGNIAVMRYLLTKGADVNYVSAYGYTCLHIAAFHGFLHVGEFILSLEEFKRKNATDFRGYSALDIACHAERSMFIHMIMDSGVVYSPIPMQEPLIVRMCHQRRENAIKAIVFADPMYVMDYTLTDHRGCSLLMLAVQYNLMASLQLFMDLNLGTEVKNKFGDYLIHLCVKMSVARKNTDALKIVHGKCDLSVRNIQNETPLHLARRLLINNPFYRNEIRPIAVTIQRLVSN